MHFYLHKIGQVSSASLPVNLTVQQKRHKLLGGHHTIVRHEELVSVKGRIVLLGDSATSYGTKAGTGLVAYSASRKAVEGAAEALKSELQSSGVDVVLLKPPPVNPLILYSSPVLKT